jgi:regulator of protease activity HflC (stomatin/prohibitin superfamily)
MKGMGSYLILVSGAVAVVGILGFAAPLAVSSRSSELVIMGFGLLLFLPVIAMALIYLWRKTKDAKWLMEKMKRFAPLILIALMVGACSKVPAGNVGVVVNLYGSDKGVSEREVGVGKYWLSWNEELYLFPTFTQNDNWVYAEKKDESIYFQTGKDGMTVSSDFGITFRVDPTKVTKLYQTYRKGVEEISDIYLRNLVRDAVNEKAAEYSADQVYGPMKNVIMDFVEDAVRKAVAPQGIIVEKVYLIGAVRLPKVVRDSIDQKNMAFQATLQREQEINKAKAEAEIKIAEANGRAQSVLLEARAQSEANKLVAASITPELVRYRALDKWDGALPRLNGGGTVPFIDVTADAAPKAITR